MTTNVRSHQVRLRLIHRPEGHSHISWPRFRPKKGEAFWAKSWPQFHVQIADKLEQCLPQTERALIPGAFGGLHTTNPQAYNETVLVFLAKQ